MQKQASSSNNTIHNTIYNTSRTEAQENSAPPPSKPVERLMPPSLLQLLSPSRQLRLRPPLVLLLPLFDRTQMERTNFSISSPTTLVLRAGQNEEVELRQMVSFWTNAC
jgi:hypothetical protein